MKKYDLIKIGDRAEIRHRISRSDIESFVRLTGDDNRLHVDESFAKTTTFKKPVAHGMLSASFISTIIGTKLPGDGALWFSQNLEFLLPVRIDDEIRIVAEVTKKIDHIEAIEIRTDIFNQDNQKVIAGSAKVKIISEQTKADFNIQASPSKTALVIGATGGIGSEVAKTLTHKGYTVGIHYNQNKEGAEKLIAQLRELNEKTFSIRADLSIESDIDDMVFQVSRRFDTLSILVNATTPPLNNIKFDSLEWSDIEKHFHLNIKSNFFVIKKIIPLMRKQKYGKIITILTQAIEQPNTEWLHYITAKTALSGFSKSLSVELAKDGIRVNMVSPGMTNTNLIANIPEKFQLLNAAKTPLKRNATTIDVANAIVFLASPDSDFLTGETIRVNGGQVMI